MADTVADASQPWYRSLNATQWKTLFASNLGWMFDGYETFALILTVGVALRSLLDPSLYPQIPAYAGTVIAITLLGWGVGGLIGRHPRGLYRPPADDDLRHPGLFADDGPERARLGLDVVCGVAVLSRCRDRLRMVDRRLHDRRGLAQPRPRERRRADAMRPRHRFFPRVARLAVRGRDGAGCMAHHVPARHPAGIRCAVDPHRGSRIGNVGSDGSAAPCRARPAEERRGARRARAQAHPLHRRRTVRRPRASEGHRRGVPDVADHDAGMVGHLDLGPPLHRLGRG